jgi:outer membrane protein assembly factor BamB
MMICRNRAKPFQVALATLVATSIPLFAADWPRYRGPNLDGVSAETAWSSDWPKAGPPQLWRASLGTGASSVAINAGRLYTMGNINDTDIVYCLDAATGREIWRHSYRCPLEKRQFEGGPAATPTVDGERVYTLSHDGDLFCLNAATGQVIWRKQIQHDFGGSRPRWGYAGSPLIEGDMVIVDAGGAGSSTLALNKLDGRLVWKSGNDDAGYASPIAYTAGGDTRVVVLFKARALVGKNAASGAELWRHPWQTAYDVNAPTPIVAGNLIFITSGYNTGCAVIELRDGRPVERWRNRAIASQFNSAVLRDGHVYGIDGNTPRGDLVCVELATGEEKWRQGGFGCGSLKLAGQRLIVLGERGELFAARADSTGYNELARAQVLGGRCWVVPVLSGGRLYCKNNQGELVCLDVSDK